MLKWTTFKDKLPDIGMAFITPYSDGSGGRVFKRTGENKFTDADGDSSYGIEHIEDAHSTWAELPDDFQFFYENNPPKRLLTNTLIHKMVLGETIGRHLVKFQGDRGDLEAYHNALSEQIRNETNFSQYSEEQINEMRLEIITWCKKELEKLTES